MRVDASKVIARRREERRALLARADGVARSVPAELDVRAVVVFGSVARGDFNKWSDIDVLVVAERIAQRPLDRHAQLGRLPGRVQPVVWTTAEFRERSRRGDPIAREVVDAGVWLLGALPQLTDLER